MWRWLFYPPALASLLNLEICGTGGIGNPKDPIDPMEALPMSQSARWTDVSRP